MTLFLHKCHQLDCCLSATDTSSEMSNIPRAEIELNSKSLLLYGLQFTTDSTSAASALFRLSQEAPENCQVFFQYQKSTGYKVLQ